MPGRKSWRLTRLRKITASTESVLGFFADALAIGGLALLAVPALVRVLRRRDRTVPDVGLAVLGLVALVSFAGFVTMLLRFPQQYDDPIKSSYLLYTAPCWAIFSVGAWSWIRAHHYGPSTPLVVAATVYVVTYGTDLGNALAYPSGLPAAGNGAGFVDLSPIFQQTSANPALGTEVDFLTSVANNGNQTAGKVVLTLQLDPGMRLLGLPYYQQGPGWQSGRALRRVPARLPSSPEFDLHPLRPRGRQSARADDRRDGHLDQYRREPGNNTASYTITLAPA